jgi:hypothetical protein
MGVYEDTIYEALNGLRYMAEVISPIDTDLGNTEYFWLIFNENGHNWQPFA